MNCIYKQGLVSIFFFFLRYVSLSKLQLEWTCPLDVGYCGLFVIIALQLPLFVQGRYFYNNAMIFIKLFKSGVTDYFVLKYLYLNVIQDVATFQFSALLRHIRVFTSIYNIAIFYIIPLVFSSIKNLLMV